MDPISQGALGAIAATSFAGTKEVRWACLIGWASGMLADADIFIRSESDPLLNIEYHRHFSHSLSFIPFGALIAAAVFFLFLRRKMAFRNIYAYSLIGYATAGPLDACTSYGTRLFWPFSDMRVAWNIISIIDPIFTLTILGLIAYGLWRNRNLFSRIAVAFALLYFGFGIWQNRRADAALEALAISRGHQSHSKRTVKPSIGNLILWRGIYEHQNAFEVDAIRIGLFGDVTIYKGSRVDVFDKDSFLKAIPRESTLAKDILRFDHFSDGYLAPHPDIPNVIGDARYAAVPNAVYPLWGIRIDDSDLEKHVTFENFRNFEQIDREALLGMLKGQPLNPKL